MTTMSRFVAAMTAFDTAPGLSMAIPRSTASAPQLLTKADKKAAFELMIWPGPGVWPGSTSSSPVDKMPIRGGFDTTALVAPAAIASPIERADNKLPLARARAPAAISNPAGRIYRPLAAPSRTVITLWSASLGASTFS